MIFGRLYQSRLLAALINYNRHLEQGIMAKADIFVFKFVVINLNKSLKGSYNVELSITQSSLMSWLGSSV